MSELGAAARRRKESMSKASSAKVAGVAEDNDEEAVAVAGRLKASEVAEVAVTVTAARWDADFTSRAAASSG
jgi:hypothetical protein